mmetsp:Transcript_24761/g.57176  ORF Transcript_24761/g.57176 Transcript_24761/m.57176 type:complete len:216 (-) Transcript_24761:90-737(-)
MVCGTKLGVNIVGGGPCSIYGVHSYTSLETAACSATKFALHVPLHHKILSRLCYVYEAAHLQAGQARDSSCQLWPILCNAKGLGHCIDGWHNHRVIKDVLHELTIQVALDASPSQRRQVLLSSVNAWLLDFSGVNTTQGTIHRRGNIRLNHACSLWFDSFDSGVLTRAGLGSRAPTRVTSTDCFLQRLPRGPMLLHKIFYINMFLCSLNLTHQHI